MQPKFDATKPVQTRDGRKARIIATDKRGVYPIVALAEDDGEEITCVYTHEGMFWRDGTQSRNDLVNVPKKRTVYINLYESFVADKEHRVYDISDSAAAADARAAGVSRTRHARLRVEFVEGQFDE